MKWFVLFGALLSIAGLIGLGVCIARALKLRRAGLEGDALAEGLRPLVAINLGSLAFSVLGLMLVILGLSFG